MKYFFELNLMSVCYFWHGACVLREVIVKNCSSTSCSGIVKCGTVPSNAARGLTIYLSAVIIGVCLNDVNPDVSS